MVVTLANGEVHECSGVYIDEISDVLVVNLAENDIAEAVRAFSDESKTREIVWNGTMYSGYTRISIITVHSWGVKIMLRRA